jgi:hypothetical protein
VTSGVDLLFGSDFGSLLFIVYILLVLQKNSVFVLCGQKDKSTPIALVVSNFAIDEKT